MANAMVWQRRRGRERRGHARPNGRGTARTLERRRAAEDGRGEAGAVLDGNGRTAPGKGHTCVPESTVENGEVEIGRFGSKQGFQTGRCVVRWKEKIYRTVERGWTGIGSGHVALDGEALQPTRQKPHVAHAGCNKQQEAWEQCQPDDAVVKCHREGFVACPVRSCILQRVGSIHRAESTAKLACTPSHPNKCLHRRHELPHSANRSARRHGSGSCPYAGQSWALLQATAGMRVPYKVLQIISAFPPHISNRCKQHRWDEHQ